MKTEKVKVNRKQRDLYEEAGSVLFIIGLFVLVLGFFGVGIDFFNALILSAISLLVALGCFLASEKVSGKKKVV